MSTKPDWGVRMQDKSALAVELAARRQGTTMGEIKSHNGQNQYNVFKRLEEVGHTVIRKGSGSSMRIWVHHRDEKGAENKSGEEPLDTHLDETTSYSSGPTEITFSLERDLQLALRKNLYQRT